MPEAFTREQLEQLVYHHRPHAGRLNFEPIPTGKFNTSYYVRAGEQEWVLRIAPPDDAVFVFYERGMMCQEPELHTLLLSETSVPVARILVFDQSRDLIDRNYMLMERLPGRPWTELHGVDGSRVLRQVGEYLAEVHALTREQYGYLGAHHPMEPQPAWQAAFRVMWNKLIDDVVSVGHYDAEESGWLRGLLEERLSLFDRQVPASLLHMDLWHQNILLDRAGNVTGIVDWDRALWGDPEIEFAVLDYTGLAEPDFWEGYGRVRDESPEARIRQVFYLLYELQKYIVIRQGRGHDARAARHYKAQVFELARRFFA